MTGSLSESLSDDPLVIAGPKYKNVNNPTNCIISFIYSKSSVGFLCLIGCLTTISTYLFTTQIAKSNLLCMFNDYLPIDEELRKHAKPTRYYCRMLEFSVPVNILQLLFCLAALFFALNRRSRLFFTCYVLLGLSLTFSTGFMIFLYLLNYEKFIYTAVDKVLHTVVRKDDGFCQVLEPLLACKLEGPNGVDLIEDTCQQPRRHLYLANNCLQHLTAFLDQKKWLLALVIQYGIIVVVGILIILRSGYKFRLKRNRLNKQPSRVITMHNGECADHHILQNGAQV